MTDLLAAHFSSQTAPCKALLAQIRAVAQSWEMWFALRASAPVQTTSTNWLSCQELAGPADGFHRGRMGCQAEPISVRSTRAFVVIDPFFQALHQMLNATCRVQLPKDRVQEPSF